MRFTVTWTKNADRTLAATWMESKDRNGITLASAEVDRELKVDAHTKGFEVAEGLRAINIPPLRFLFSADLQDRVVEIAVVREI